MITQSVMFNDFEVWSGESVFELQNGEIWERDGYKFQYFYAYRPMAIIEHNGDQGVMTVNGSTCSVKRAKQNNKMLLRKA